MFISCIYRGAHTLISTGTGAFGELVDSVNSETMKANKYVDILGVSLKRLYCQSSIDLVSERKKEYQNKDYYVTRSPITPWVTGVHILASSQELVLLPSRFAFPRARVFGLWMIVTLNTAFISGSSKQGNTFLASVGCKLVATRNLWDKKSQSFIIRVT